MIPAKKSVLFNKIFGFYHNRLLRKHFFRIHLSGGQNLNSLVQGYPSILYANHSNWWDGFIAYFLTSRLWKRDDYLMMDIRQMSRYPVFKYLGVFSVDSSNANETLQSVNYAAALLKNTERFMWIFPQGKMEVQDKRPFGFLGGITRLAEKTGSVNLLPVALRYEFIMEQRPEVFISLGEPVILNNFSSAGKNFTSVLKDKLVNEMDKLKDCVLNNRLESFITVFHGKESRNKTIDRIKNS